MMLAVRIYIWIILVLLLRARCAPSLPPSPLNFRLVATFSLLDPVKAILSRFFSHIRLSQCRIVKILSFSLRGYRG